MEPFVVDARPSPGGAFLKTYEVDKIRNVGLVGHQDTGKTTFLEVVLFETKQVSRLSRVDDHNSNLDFSPEEIDRHLTMKAALVHAEWQGHKINFVDTPGYDDFGAEELAALSVVETALVFVKAESGPEVGTERVWRDLEERSKPRFLVLNKMDKEHANFEKSLKLLQERLSRQIIPLHLPIGQGESFRGVVDLVAQKAWTFSGDKTSEAPVPAELAAAVAAAREALLNAAAETDDALTEKFLETGELTPEELRVGLSRGVARGSVFPLLVACSGRGQGIAGVLDALVDFAPSPATVESVAGTAPGGGTAVSRKPSASEPLAALAFKTISETNVGDYTYIRVFSGKLVPGLDVLNASTGQSERVGPVYLLNGKIRSDVEALSAGDIGAAVKLKGTHTGNTLCDRAAPIAMPFSKPHEPLAFVAIKAKGKGDEDKLSSGLARLHEEDPSFTVTVNSETHQTILAGQGDTHLGILIGKLKRKFGIEVETEPPRTPYRETLKGHAEERYRHKKQTGGRGQFGEVALKVEPLPRGSKFEFVDDIVGGVIPTKFIPAVEKGVIEAMHEGVIAGYPVVDVRVRVFDGKYHDVDSSEAAFKIAGAHAFRGAVPKAQPILLEPIYHIAVHVPEEYVGEVMGDLSSHRGRIQGQEQNGSFRILKAEAPLAELYSYATRLRSLTQGRATHTRTFSHYEEVPREAAEKVIAEHKAAHQAQSHSH
jgi:elongation factor G